MLFLHAALDILGQVDGVILVHGLDHGLHDDAQFALGDGLLDGNDFNMQLFAEDGFVKHGVIPVPGEAGELPQKYGVKGLGFLLGYTDEPAEVIAAGDLAAGLGLIHKHKLIRDNIAVGRAPLADLHQLRGGGKLYLVIGGDADVGGGYAVIFEGHGINLLCVVRKAPDAGAFCHSSFPFDKRALILPTRSSAKEPLIITEETVSSLVPTISTLPASLAFKTGVV